MKIFGYEIIIQRQKNLVKNRPTASSYRLWTRKGKCPVCKVATGSPHSYGCKWRLTMLSKLNRKK